MNKIAILFLSLIALHVTAQDISTEIKFESKEIGKNLESNISIRVNEYTFPYYVYDYHFDAEREGIYIVLREAGKKYFKDNGILLFYSNKYDNVIWKKDITSFKIAFHPKHIFCSKTEGGYDCINPESGEIMYHINQIPMILRGNDEIGFIGSLEAIDLNTGKEKWRREISNMYGFNDLVQLNDSTIVIAASGLHSMNINSGEGWSYEATTGKIVEVTSSGGALAAVSLGFALGGMYMGSVTSQAIVHQIASNILVDSGCLYFASQKVITCIDFNGNVLWETELLKDFTSASSIFLRNDKVFMLNTGYAQRMGQTIKLGASYIACFDCKTGKQDYVVATKARSGIVDYEFIGNELNLLSKWDVLQYDINNGNRTKKKAFEPSKTRHFKYFTEADVYFPNESGNKYKRLGKDTSDIFIVSKDLNVYALDANFEESGKYLIKNSFLNKYQYENKKYLFGINKLVLVNQNNEKLGELSYEGEYIQNENFLLIIDKNKMIFTDLNKIFTKEN